MNAKSKLTRRQLALRLFAAAVVVNGCILLLFFPATPEAAQRTELPANMVQLKIKATLSTPFEERKAVVLSQEGGQSLGPVMLMAQEEDTLTVAVTSTLYRRYHQRLGLEHWIALPYLEDLLRPLPSGVRYEIAY